MPWKPRHSQKAPVKVAKKPTEANPEPYTLKSTLKPGETKVAHQAEYMVEGLAMNALTGLAFSGRLGTLDLTECFAQMLGRAREVANWNTQSQEAILAGQIISLNAIYTDLAIIARNNMSNCVVFERLMRLALKAQSNCRATAEALAAIQNPPTVFAQQANIANGPQQINNGVPNASGSTRAEKSDSLPNELLEAHGERLDPRTESTAINCDQELATVAAVYRAEDPKR